MVEFVAIKTKELPFGNNNFIEVAHKKAITERGESEFVSISRGFITRGGEKRFKNSVALPLELVEKVSDELKSIL